MPLLLTAATREELDAALPELVRTRIPEQTVVSAWANGHPWLVCITGVGPVNAALALGLALARQTVRGVVNVGLAGSFDREAAPVGAAVLVNEEIWPEYGLVDENGVNAEALGFPQWEGPRGLRVLDRLPLPATPETLQLPSWPDLPRGPSLTVAGVTNSARRAEALRRRYSVLVENMEGFAVALACARQGVPLLEIRTVSNIVGSRAPEDRNFAAGLARLGDVMNHLSPVTPAYPS